MLTKKNLLDYTKAVCTTNEGLKIEYMINHTRAKEMTLIPTTKYTQKGYTIRYINYPIKNEQGMTLEGEKIIIVKGSYRFELSKA